MTIATDLGLPICAELIGSNTCSAAGITARNPAPVLALCRQLLAAGLNPDQAMAVYRHGTLAMRVRSLSEGARLTVKDDNRGTPRFVDYRPAPDERVAAACGESPPMRQNTAAAIGGRP